MKKRVLLVTMAVVLVGAGVYAGIYLTSRPSGPAAELALKASDVGSGWKAGELYSSYEGRVINQPFTRRIQVEDGIDVGMTVYQTTSVYRSNEAAIEDDYLSNARQGSPELTDMTFWDEAYGTCPVTDTGIILRKSNIVVILYYEHFLFPTDPVLQMEGIPPEREAEIDSQQKAAMWSFLCDLAQVIQGKIIETGGG